MTATVSIEVPEDLHASLQVCIAARDAGIAQAEDADRSGWDKALIDQAIEHLASTRLPFSANDLRVLLPEDVPGPLMGARFLAASNRGLVRYVGTTRSTKPNTHNKPVNVYVGRVQAD